MTNILEKPTIDNVVRKKIVEKKITVEENVGEPKQTITQKIKKFEAEVPKPETKKEENVAEVARKILKFEEMMKNPRIEITEEKPRNIKLSEKK